MKTLASVGLILSLLSGFGSSGQALAQTSKTKNATKPEITQDQRKNMATVHEKMAACLRSDKPISECQDEMMNNCEKMMGDEGCPMMGYGMKHHRGMMHE